MTKTIRSENTMAKSTKPAQDLDETTVQLDESDDAEFFINFDEVPAAGELVPEGTFEAFVAHAEKLKGNNPPFAPYIALRWKIDDPAAVDVGAQGRVVFDSLSWHPNAISMTRSKLEGLGFPTSFKGKIDTEMLLGERALIVVKTKKSDPTKRDENDEPYPDKSVVKRIKPLGQRRRPEDL